MKKYKSTYIKCINNLGLVLMHVPSIHWERNRLVIWVVRLVKWFINVRNDIKMNVGEIVWSNIRKSKKQSHISIQYIKKIIIIIQRNIDKVIRCPGYLLPKFVFLLPNLVTKFFKTNPNPNPNPNPNLNHKS